MKQRTIKNIIHIKGVGLHSGKDCEIEIHPSEENTGINFVRMDISPHKIIKATYRNVQNTMLSTSIVDDGIEIKTIEHLFSAFAGLKIDNALVKIFGSEIPILDGSSRIFVDEILKSGIVVQEANRFYLKIKKDIKVYVDDKFAEIKPYDGTRFEFRISYNNAYINNTPNIGFFDEKENSFINDVSVARTFGFQYEIDYLKKENLINGGSLENAIVVTEDNILNKTGLRIPDEFVKHKILDAIGDMYLLNYPILGMYYGYKSGHQLNNLLARKIMNDPSNYEIVSG